MSELAPCKVSTAAPDPDRPEDRASGLRILAGGVDSLYASVRGTVREGLLQVLGDTRALGGKEGTVVAFGEDESRYLLRAHGWRGFPFWLSSPRFELFIGAADPFPPAYMALHSTYIHTLGVETAVADAHRLLSEGFFEGEAMVVPSRMDIYADTQGWQPQVADFDRFVCRAIRRRLFEQPRQLHGDGRMLSGFVFGKGDLVGRIYDKTLEMRAHGSTWQELIWSGREPGDAVWRVEFQFRRKGLTTFGVRSMEQALGARQDLWDYGTGWLSLREPNGHSLPRRWPVAPVWRALSRAAIGSPRSGLIRERIRLADERRLVSGFVGYASSLAAMTGESDVHAAMRRAVPLAVRYLDERGTRFPDLVDLKRSRRLATRQLDRSRLVNS